MRLPSLQIFFVLLIFIVLGSTQALAESTVIPQWVKQVAEFWITDQIDDSGFVQVIEYLVQQDIISIPYAQEPEGEAASGVPVWIKTSAEFWVQGDVSDDEFAAGLEWLINNGIILVSDSLASESKLSGEITIGLILPLTGDLATHGIENHAGSKFGVEEFNKHLQEIGENWHLKMVSEDSATSPVIALEKLTSLNAKGIGIVVGPETSSNIRNIKGYSDSNNMLLVSCCSSAPALAIPNDSVFRLVPDDRNQGTALAKLIQHEGIEVLVPVWRGDTWGDGLSKAATSSFEQRGGIIDEGIRYNPESPEFSASTSLLAANVQGYVDMYGADKVAVLFLGFAEVLQFMQSASEHDVLDKVRWFGPGANTKEHKLIEDPIGLDFSTNVQFTTVQFAASKNPTYDKVQKHLTETLGTDPNTFVHSSYDAVWIIGLAILETQTTDVSVIKEKIPEIANSYSGAIGPTKLNEAGDLAQADYEVWGIRGAQWVHLGKYTQSDDSVTLN
jgi:branched-chain amino acid transport system substrate-binding protein